jgi:hypothetical protein
VISLPKGPDMPRETSKATMHISLLSLGQLRPVEPGLLAPTESHHTHCAGVLQLSAGISLLPSRQAFAAIRKPDSNCDQPCLSCAEFRSGCTCLAQLFRAVRSSLVFSVSSLMPENES